jgi:hypothetical protein
MSSNDSADFNYTKPTKQLSWPTRQVSGPTMDSDIFLRMIHELPDGFLRQHPLFGVNQREQIQRVLHIW